LSDVDAVAVSAATPNTRHSDRGARTTMTTTIPSGSIDTSGAQPSPDSNFASETERALSSARLCKACGVPLVGRRRQAQFCSGRCRTEHRRGTRANRLAQLVEAVEKAVTALKGEIGTHHE